MSIRCCGGSKKRGSAVLEAAIFVPVFYLTILLMVLMIRMIGAEMKIYDATVTESLNLAKEAYLSPWLFEEGTETSGGVEPIEILAARGIYHLRLRQSIEQTEPTLPQNIALTKFQYLITERKTDALIRAELQYEIKIPFPLGQSRTVAFREPVLFRAFLGSTGNPKTLPASVLERKEPSDPVYVFPKAGEKYHHAGCRIIAAYAKETVLTEALKQQYHACALCHPPTANGALVFCFPGSGEAYHTASCHCVEKYVISYECYEAKSKGYLPCKLCGN